MTTPENPLPLLFFFVAHNSYMASNYKIIHNYTFLIGRYLAMDFDYDGNWQAMLFHAHLPSLAVRKLLVSTQIRTIGL